MQSTPQHPRRPKTVTGGFWPSAKAAAHPSLGRLHSAQGGTPLGLFPAREISATGNPLSGSVRKASTSYNRGFPSGKTTTTRAMHSAGEPQDGDGRPFGGIPGPQRTTAAGFGAAEWSAQPAVLPISSFPPVCEARAENIHVVTPQAWRRLPLRLRRRERPPARCHGDTGSAACPPGVSGTAKGRRGWSHRRGRNSGRADRGRGL